MFNRNHIIGAAIAGAVVLVLGLFFILGGKHSKPDTSFFGRIANGVSAVTGTQTPEEMAAAPEFVAIPGVVNGASDLIVEALGAAGRHARSAVGVAQLPLGSVVASLVTFVVVYAIVFGFGTWYLVKLVRAGPIAAPPRATIVQTPARPISAADRRGATP